MYFISLGWKSVTVSVKKINFKKGGVEESKLPVNMILK